MELTFTKEPLPELTFTGNTLASQHNPELGADWVQDDGLLVIGGDWLTEIGITESEHMDVATAPGIIIIRRRRGGILKA